MSVRHAERASFGSEPCGDDALLSPDLKIVPFMFIVYIYSGLAAKRSRLREYGKVEDSRVVTRCGGKPLPRWFASRRSGVAVETAVAAIGCPCGKSSGVLGGFSWEAEVKSRLAAGALVGAGARFSS
jgi:hypothetical protein